MCNGNDHGPIPRAAAGARHRLPGRGPSALMTGVAPPRGPAVAVGGALRRVQSRITAVARTCSPLEDPPCHLSRAVAS